MMAGRMFGGVAAAVGLLVVSCETPAPERSAAAQPGAAERPSEQKRDAARQVESAPATRPVSAPEAAAPSPKPPKGQVSKIDIGTLFALQGEGRAFIVDVRPAFFYNVGHIPGATSMPLKSYDTLFPAKRAEFDAAVAAGKVIVIYCADETCPDGRSTARRLAKEGYSSSVYTAGWKEWKDSGL